MSAFDEYDPVARREIEDMADAIYNVLMGHDINLAINALAHVLADVCASSVGARSRSEVIERYHDYVRDLLPEYIKVKHDQQN